METYILHLNDIKGINNIHQLLIDKLFPRKPFFNTDDSVLPKIQVLFDALCDNLCVVVETEYVDKDYRDAFYRLYSTKLRDYERNCVRLSFFNDGLQPILENIVSASEKDITRLKEGYLGFVVLRPLKQCIGRNIISPMAMKHGVGMSLCGIRMRTSCLGLKLSVWGFPHASQDGQLMTCAETTVWAISEYFGEKYSHYSRIYPHGIVDMLHDSVYERQIPSHGLTYEMISLALQKQHFECKVYHKANARFRELFNCYVESEFPLAVAIEGNDSQGIHFGHAIVCIGQQTPAKSAINTVLPRTINNVQIYNWNNAISEFVSIDDNMMPYQFFDFNRPTIHYGNPDWSNTEITCFIVPLHPKIYIEAEEALGISEQQIAYTHTAGSEVYVRTLLTTSRSYREYILMQPTIPNDTKEMMLSINLPKFVWLTEVSNKTDFLSNMVNEVLLIDATADSDDGLDAVIEHLDFIKPVESFKNLRSV